MKILRQIAVLTVLVLWPGPVAAQIVAPSAPQLELIMFEQVGCSYCARWTREIGPIYPLTSEGESAPLRHVDIHDPMPADITLDRRASFTPTFVLLKDGKEVSRLEGYPGEDFFWGLLAQMIANALDS